MSGDVVTWILGSVIAFSFTIIGFLVKFLFGKAATWGEKLDQVVSDLRVINHEMKRFAERADRHDNEIQGLRSRIHLINDKLSQIIAMFELIRFSDCSDECPLSKLTTQLREKDHENDANYR